LTSIKQRTSQTATIPAMHVFRRRHLRLRSATIAMLALLWSQTALAWHALCAMPVSPPVVQASAHSADCHAQVSTAADDAALCDAHCDQGTPSPDTARIPLPPALPALVPALAAALPVLHAAASRRWVDSPPPASRHRPTPHPAALLLI